MLADHELEAIVVMTKRRTATCMPVQENTSL